MPERRKLHYQKDYDAFREQAAARGTRVYNPLSGRGDLAGKQYLLDLTTAGYLDQGIQRVDACRTQDGELLLVEPEDLNPYLSLDLVPERPRGSFMENMTSSLHRFLDTPPHP